MILVCSTGRAGTSEVARILIELGVNMGKRHNKGDKFNPKGYFEDKDFQEINIMYAMIKGSPQGEKIWKERFNKLVVKRKEPWGLKDPGIADFPQLLEHYLNLKPQAILCTRNKTDTVNSFMRMKNITQEQAERIYDNRTQNLKVLKGHLTIDCYETNKKEKIWKWMKKNNKHQ
jgi:hypothetical protein